MKRRLLKTQLIVILFLIICKSASAQWTKVNMLDSIPESRPTSFVIGDTAYLGNGDTGFFVYSDAFRGYTQNSNVWGHVRKDPSGGGDWGFRFVIGDTAYVGDGADPGWLSSFYLYTPTTGWTNLPIGGPGGNPRAYMAAFSIGYKGYAGLGTYGSTLYNDFWEYDPLANTWTQMAPFPGPPNGRLGTASFSCNGKGYVGLGGDGTGKTYRDMYQYDPVANKWDTMAPMPSDTGMEEPGYFVLCGKLIVTCGDSVQSGNHTTKQSWLFDPTVGPKGRWLRLGDFPGPLPAYAPGGFTMGDTGFIYGGFNNNTYSYWAHMYRFVATAPLMGMTASPIDTTICAGNSVTLNAVGSISYLWSTTDTTINDTVSPTITTTYTVNLSDGGCMFTDSIIVNVSSGPSVTISPNPATVCNGQNILLTASGGNGSIYTWSNATGAIANTDTTTVNPLTTTTYYVTDTNGTCIGYDSITVSVDVAPALIITPSAPILCSGATVTIIADTTGKNYTWSPTTGLSETTGDSVIANPSVNTTYTIGGTDSLGCVVSSTVVVTVDSSPALIVLPQPGPLFCSGLSAELRVSGGGSDFNWSPSNSLSTSTGDSVLASPIVTTTYMVSGNDSAGCAATGTEIVTVIASPNKPTFYQHGDTLTSTSATDNQWFMNGVPLNGDTSQNLIINNTSPDSFYVVVNNEANGCSTSSDTMATTGINQLSLISNQLSLYPNPFDNEIVINISTSAQNIKDWTLQVIDVLGRTVYNQQSLNYNNTLDLSNLASGVYFITVMNKTNRAVVAVVKQN